jgi:hypothetical protein
MQEIIEWDDTAKAQLTVNGNRQKQGVDFVQSHADTLSLPLLRLTHVIPCSNPQPDGLLRYNDADEPFDTPKYQSAIGKLIWLSVCTRPFQGCGPWKGAASDHLQLLVASISGHCYVLDEDQKAYNFLLYSAHQNVERVIQMWKLLNNLLFSYFLQFFLLWKCC